VPDTALGHGARCRWLARIHNDTAVDREGLAHWPRVSLSQTVLESAHRSFVDIFGDQAATISDDVAISPGSIAKVTQRSGFFAADESFELVVLVDVKTTAISLALEACVYTGLHDFTSA